ncbi:hypothetical protein QYM36_015446 [Artemia franciscana]|uniref:Molybdopterin synthase catalytic subunit n=1 Tax=Artemia franciscana TaxID=6661 RepID=A0AA88HLM7_ARTSF|nr:hypothetical protein QYM36_015446 [Artemia franciscana]
MNSILLTHEKLDIAKIERSVTDSGTGATSIFIGTTRDHFHNRKVKKLSYEAYESMAVKEIEKLCSDTRKTWNIINIAVHHRLGDVPVKEVSVVIAASSAHRKESLAAINYLIDNLKAKVPIWKKEIYEDGYSEWKANCDCNWVPKNHK